ncbi:MAG: hypothetical protein H8D23_20295 [Candidatus Brocadiales bacterium]|nr:hypothetical protein [Candidatus Brocadiales bacterium]
MKKLIIIILLATTLFAQVDSIYTRNQIYTGQIIAVMPVLPYSIFISNELYVQKGISTYEIKRLVLQNGEIVIGEGVPKGTFLDYVQTFNSNQKAQQDSLRSYADVFQATPEGTTERLIRALERVATVVSIQVIISAILIIIYWYGFTSPFRK